MTTPGARREARHGRELAIAAGSAFAIYGSKRSCGRVLTIIVSILLAILFVLFGPGLLIWAFYTLKNRGRVTRSASIASVAHRQEAFLDPRSAMAAPHRRSPAADVKVREVAPPDRGMLAIILPFGAVGAIALIIGLWTLQSEWRFERSAVRAPGKVVRLEVSYGGKNRSYVPVVRFTGPDGASHEITGAVGRSSDDHSSGETMGVLYPPGRPLDAVLDDPVERWFMPAFGCGFALIFGGGGLGLFLFLRAQLRREARARHSGAPVMASYEGARRTGKGGGAGWRVLARWHNPMDGGQVRFVSPVTRSDPAARFAIGQSVAVRVDPQDPRAFWFEERA